MESLAAFAAKRSPGGRVCATCSSLVPAIRGEIAQARPSVSWPTISAWLKERRGVTIKPNALRNHFVAGHDKEPRS